MSQRTILITSIPAEYLTLTQLARIFGPSFKNAWIATDTKKLEELVKQRDKVAFKLEAAETKLIVTANKARMKAHKGGAAETGKDVEASQYLSHKDRPTHRTKFLIGKKVDTIDWCRTELARTIPEVQAAQDAHRSKEGSKSDGAAFIEFHSQSAAQSAVQVLQHHLPLHMSPRYIGMRPQEVVWSSLNLSWKQRVVRKWIYVAFVSVLIIFWAIPIAAAGLISNIKFLQTTFPFLSFLNKIPGPIFGVISGLLPTVAVAILVALVPIVLRLAAKWAGATSQSELDLGLQNTYYIFQVVQVFLVVTIASSASAAGGQIAANPGSTLTLLSTQLPKASNFYINFLILQGLIISSKAVLQIVGLLLFKILGRFLDSTPRKQYKRWSNLAGLTVGSTLPGLTLLVMIAITYSIISPLVLGFATIGIGFIYMAFRYNVMFVFSLDIDTNGRCYPRALMQLMVGVYLAELLLIGLFLVNVAIGPMVLMIIYTVFTILYHMSLTSALGPLFVYLPKNLEVEEESLLQLERGNGPQTGVTNGNTGEKPPLTSHTSAMRTSTKKPSMIMHFLKPHVYCNYATLRQTVPTDFAEIRYEAEVERQAYHNPAISSAAPLLWIPRDTMGISREEIAGSKSAIAMTDESAFLDDKGKVKFDEGGRIPIHEDKIYY